MNTSGQWTYDTPAPSSIVEDGLVGGDVGMPFRQVLLKLHSRCNLACDYCYVYQYADQSWRTRPRTMASATIDAVAERVAEHARRHRLDSIRVILHGGEPLLAGAAVIEYAVTRLRAAVGPRTSTDFRLTTNGVLLTSDLLDLFDRHRIRVAVSLDGGQVAHDRGRRFPNGSGSYHRVAEGLRLLADGPAEVYAGILCTVDLRNDPIDVYESLLRFQPPELDFLLPHGNWAAPPPGRGPAPDQTPYSAWLTAVFDRWYGAPRQETRIRFFDSIILLLLGGRSRTEAVGTTPIDLVTFETDGTMEQSDALKTAGTGMAATGLDVWTSTLDDALRHPGLIARQLGLEGLSATCRSCAVVSVCGGGLYAHRFRTENDFDNPSVYCPDLFRLIEHIRGRLESDLRALRQAPPVPDRHAVAAPVPEAQVGTAPRVLP